MKRYILIFFACALGVSAIFFLIPINLFDGEIVFNVNGVEFTEKAKLSLSYFIGIGASEEQMEGVKDFYLLPMGYVIAALMIVVLPAIITYRIYLKRQQKAGN